MYRGSPLRSTFNTGYMKVRTCVQYVPTANVPCARLESKVRHNMMKKVNNKIAVSLRSSTANVGPCGYIYILKKDIVCTYNHIYIYRFILLKYKKCISSRNPRPNDHKFPQNSQETIKLSRKVGISCE